MFEKFSKFDELLNSKITFICLIFLFLSTWITILYSANNNGISLREQNIIYLKELPQEKQLEILKLCYTSYHLNCNDAVYDYRKVNG